MNEIQNLYKLFSDIINGLPALYASVVIIAFIVGYVLIRYRETIAKYFKCKNDTTKLIEKVEKLTDTIERKFNCPKKDLDLVKLEMQSEISKLIFEIKNAIADIKMKSVEDASKILKFERTLEEIEKRTENILKLIKQYLDMDNLD